MKKYLIPVLLFAAAIIAACSGSPSTGANEITLEVSNLQYQPATIEVAAGQWVRMTMRNNDSVEHDFSILEIPMATMGATAAPMVGHDMGGLDVQPQLHMVAAMGATNTVEFTPTKPGAYEFFCAVPGHKDAGMKGTLVVKAP